MLKVPSPWQCPSSALAPPQGAPDSSDWLGALRGEAGLLGAQPLPRVLERVATKAADFPAVDHAGRASSNLLTLTLTLIQAGPLR
eukprot:scaffold10620_cov48-Phaeocystis_antarctica.AAC.1